MSSRDARSPLSRVSAAKLPHVCSTRTHPGIMDEWTVLDLGLTLGTGKMKCTVSPWCWKSMGSSSIRKYRAWFGSRRVVSGQEHLFFARHVLHPVFYSSVDFVDKLPPSFCHVFRPECLAISTFFDQHMNMRSRLNRCVCDVPGSACLIRNHLRQIRSIAPNLAMRIRFVMSGRNVPLPLVGVVSDALHVQALLVLLHNAKLSISTHQHLDVSHQCT